MVGKYTCAAYITYIYRICDYDDVLVWPSGDVDDERHRMRGVVFPQSALRSAPFAPRQRAKLHQNVTHILQRRHKRKPNGSYILGWLERIWQERLSCPEGLSSVWLRPSNLRRTLV